MEKTRLCDINTDILIGSPRRYETLTGSEIEQIWCKEMQNQAQKSYNESQIEIRNENKTYTQEEVDDLLDREAARTAAQILKNKKKQFVEFNYELAQSYISKFSDIDKRKFFKLMLNTMQEQIIGYINVYGNRYEPAISSTETFMPLSSFGLSNTHIHNKFIPFPDNKTLSDMIKDPNYFNNWLNENNL